MKLDEKLVSLRKEKGITQLKVAEELDISRQAISRWESGVAMPSTENLRRLSELYSVPLDYLINEDSEQPARVEEDNGEKRKNGKWSSLLEPGENSHSESGENRQFWPDENHQFQQGRK